MVKARSFLLYSLENYRVKQLDDPKKSTEIITELKDGNRPVVTVEGKDGKDMAMRIEAVPRMVISIFTS